MNESVLHDTALAMVAPDKGILAADESTGTIEKRFKAVHVDSTEANRRAYRELLFTSAGMEQWISGVILFEETLFQATVDGIAFPQLLADKGVVPGIKVDRGAKALAGSPIETVTEGLDGLRDRLGKYREAGARFAKWRAVIAIGPVADGPRIPTDYAIRVNAHALARYAALCQEAELVPIVEPEVLMDGDNSWQVCAEVTDRVLEMVFHELFAQRVVLEGMILKPNMIVSGKQCPQQADCRTVARETLRVLRRRVPAAVPGIAFLSGGQSDEHATAHLDEMNKLGNVPWRLSFSYGRALQAQPQKTWAGRPDNVEAAQRAFLHRARMNGLATAGRWKPQLEKAA